jgi:hypothetical protein
MAKGVKTGGRKVGSVNKVTADIKALAQSYGAEAVATLASIMATSENDQARISAAKELIDRGYGKASQPVTLSDPAGNPITILLQQIEGTALTPKDAL